MSMSMASSLVQGLTSKDSSLPQLNGFLIGFLLDSSRTQEHTTQNSGHYFKPVIKIRVKKFMGSKTGSGLTF